MMLYLDTSALVKRYVAEAGSEAVNAWMEAAEVLTTGLLTRAELAAAITRLSRMQLMESSEALRILGIFRDEWESLLRLPVTETTVQRADQLACQHGLRGYDAVHLATALIWRETTKQSIHLVTYDRLLWQAARAEGVLALPDLLP
jgi:predicted nucleic acid-binding protein